MKIFNETVQVEIVEQAAEFAQYVSLDDDPRMTAVKVVVVGLWTVLAVAGVVIWKSSKED